MFVDGVLVPDPTPAAIAQLLNTQESKQLMAVDVLLSDYELPENPSL